MAGRQRNDDLWSQDTDVFEPVRGDVGPADIKQHQRSDRTRRYLIIGAVAGVVVTVLAVGGVYLGGQLGKSSTSTAAATQFAATSTAPTTSAQAAPSASGASQATPDSSRSASAKP